jgi:tetratricopeptide (TPR) repeat protein
LGASISLDAAEQRLLRALEKEPDDLMANNMAALLYNAKGEPEKGASYAEKTIAIDPNYPNAYTILGAIRRGQGRAQESVALNEKAIRLSPRDPFVDLFYRDLGITYLLLGKDREAVPWLEKAVATNDKVWIHHAYLMSAYALIGRMDAAHKEIETAGRLSPGQTVAKRVAAMNRFSSNETYRKGVEHVASGLRAAGMPET